LPGPKTVNGKEWSVTSERSAAANDACDRARTALQGGDVHAGLRHYEYAQRLAPADGEITLAKHGLG
jgi:hypothetical protein